MSEVLRILVAEDRPDDAELMILTLRRDGWCPIWERVDSDGGLRAALAAGPWDAVLCDYSLPGFGAIPALALVREFDPDMPFLIVSGTIGEEVAVDCMRAGANDYVLKPGLARLAPALRRELREAAIRRAHRAAEQDARWLAAIVSSTDDAVISTSLDDRITSWNPGAERMFGWTVAEALGRPISDIVPPDRVAEFSAAVARVRSTGRSEQVETTRLRKDGSPVYILGTLSPIRDADGRVVGYSRIARDITPRRLAEDALRESERRFRELVEKVHLVTVSIDLDGRVTFANDFLLNLTGWRGGEILGQNWFDVFVPDERRAELKQAFFEPHLRETIPVHFENEILTRQGMRRLIAWNNTVLRDNHGRVTGVISLGEDITDRRRAEESLRARTEELRVTTQQLWQAARLAGVGELAASIAHELNNPLGTVTLRVEGVLARTPPDDPRRKALEVVEGEVGRMGALVANLLQFSRAGRDQISTVDVREEISKTIELTEHHMRKHGIRVEAAVAGDLPAILADRQHLRQVFLNLFINAADAMPTGGRLSVCTRTGGLTGGGPAVVVEVSDTGVGIPHELLPRVFDPFFTTKEEGKGTGLGLAICKRIVDQHQGTVEIESEPGRGTTIRIRLPVQSDAGATDLPMETGKRDCY